MAKKIMEITIKITKKQAEHLKSPHTFYDECGNACEILIKVQKEIDKIQKKMKNDSKRKV